MSSVIEDNKHRHNPLIFSPSINNSIQLKEEPEDNFIKLSISGMANAINDNSATTKLPKLTDPEFQECTFFLPKKSIKITFSKGKQGELTVDISSATLLLKSVNKELLSLFYKLYSNDIVMKSFHTGNPKSASEVEKYVKAWGEAFANLSPFGAFAAFRIMKNEKDEMESTFIGNISPDHNGDLPGKGELTYLILPEYWRQGFAKTMTEIVLNVYLPASIFIGCNLCLRGAEFSEMIATARVDNEPSQRILNKFMDLVPNSSQEMYGFKRVTFSVSKKVLLERFGEQEIIVSYKLLNSKCNVNLDL